MSSANSKGGRFGLFNKLAPKRKVNTHISQYYKRGGDRRDSESSTDKRHRDHGVGKWAAFKNIFSPLSFSTYRESRKNRRPKQSKDMVMYHHLVVAGLDNDEEAAVDLSDKDGDNKEGDNSKKVVNRKGNEVENRKDENGEWSTFTHSNTETNV